MASSYARAAKLGRSQRKKKTTNAAGSKNKSATISTTARSVLATTQRGHTSSHSQYPSSDNSAVISQQQQQQQQQLQQQQSNVFDLGTNIHYPSSSFHQQQGFSAASNSQPSSVIFYSSNTENQENAGHVGFSQLTCSQSLTNDSRGADSTQNSIVAPSELHQNSASSSNSTSRSSGSFYLRTESNPSLFRMVTGQPSRFDTMNSSQQQQQQPSSKPHRQRSWMMASGVASVLSKAATTHRKSHGAGIPATTRSLHDAAVGTSSRQDYSVKILDRDPKPQETTPNSNELQTNETSINSLITDHFKKIVAKPQDKNEPHDNGYAKREEHLVEKQKDMEVLFTTKQQGFEALALDIETKQKGLQKFAAELEEKMRGFDDRVQQETTGALARLNAAANDGVDKINRGMESFHKLFADAKASFKSSVQKLLPSVVYNQAIATTNSSQRFASVASSQKSKDSKKSDDASSSDPSQVSSVPSTVHVPTATTEHGKHQRAPKAKASSTTVSKRTKSTSKVVPTRASSRLKKAKPTFSTPKRSTVRKSRSSSKASCVTPSRASHSPVSISITRRTTTKKRLGAATTAKTAVESTRTKKRLPDDAPTQQRGRKKARMASTAASTKRVPSPEAVSDTQSSSEYTFVSPVLKEMSKRRKEGKGRRHYGGRRSSGKRITSLDDCFDFISQES